MRDVRDALEALKDIIGAQTLEFDGLGRAELVIEDQISIYLFRISDRDLELAAYTTTVDRHVSHDQLHALLRLNAIRSGLRRARFALDVRNVPFLSQRINVHLADREALDRLVLGFIQNVMTYRDADLGHVMNPGRPLRANDLPMEGDGSSFIRA